MHKIKDAILRTHTSASYCKQFSYNVQVMTWSTFRVVLKRDFKDYLTRDQKFISIKNLLRMGIFLHPRMSFITFIHCFDEHSFKYLLMSLYVIFIYRPHFKMWMDFNLNIVLFTFRSIWKNKNMTKNHQWCGMVWIVLPSYHVGNVTVTHTFAQNISSTTKAANA